MEYKYLNIISSPEDLRKLPVEALPIYCAEIRQYIIEQCAVNPGHLASSLGAVELAVAIHYVYNTPNDYLVWDVGHQAYAHKIITERKEAFQHNRQKDGISGFPRMAESKYDSFGAGHASVSISAAYGLLKASMLRGEKRKAVAVIGDGAMTGGLAFEGMNNSGVDKDADILVILNDNNMSIDHSQGALNNYLLRLSTSKRYNSFKQWFSSLLYHTPILLKFCRSVSNMVKHSLLQNSNLFESLGFRYFGRVNGNDVCKLVRTLTALKDIHSPKLLHTITQKGYGYAPAEKDLTTWHAPGKFNPTTGERIASTEHHGTKFQKVFGTTLLDLAKMDSRVVGVTPAMPTGCSMNILAEQMPSRCFDVGIAEGHAVTFSAGLAAGGMRPFCNIYSTFMQRAYDNVIHDVALQNLPVVLCLDRGGIVGEDGATHHGAFDLAYMSAIPNLVVAAPADEAQLRDMMYSALNAGVPYSIRYPRGEGCGAEWKDKPFETIPIGKGRVIKEEGRVAILTIGAVLDMAIQASQIAEKNHGISSAIYDLRFAKPLDKQLILEVGKKFNYIITVEDGALRGGVGEAVTKLLADNNLRPKVVSLGIPDRFIEQGTPQELYGECGFDQASIITAILNSIHYKL